MSVSPSCSSNVAGDTCDDVSVNPVVRSTLTAVVVPVTALSERVALITSPALTLYVKLLPPESV